MIVFQQPAKIGRTRGFANKNIPVTIAVLPHLCKHSQACIRKGYSHARMRKYIFLVLLTCAAAALYAQQPLSAIRRAGWQTLVYKIPADVAANYIRNYVVYPEDWLSQPPFHIFHADSVKKEQLPPGNYLFISVQGNELVGEVYCRSNMQVATINGSRSLQLEVKDRNTGNIIHNASVLVNKRPAVFDAATHAYKVQQRKPDEALVRIATPGDTLFAELYIDHEEKSSWSQWWRNVGYTKPGYIISYPVKWVRTRLRTPVRYWFSGKTKKQYRYKGYMLFSQPKYKPGDTVRLKAYILNKKRKPFRSDLDVHLEYYDGQSHSKKLATVSPLSDGAYVYSFALGDSLPVDKKYSITFNRKGTRVLSDYFGLEEYLLDEISTYTLRADKETYLRKDTIQVFATAKDANGLGLLDGRVRLTVLAQDIHAFYKERVYVPDTLWQGELPVAVNGDTRFAIPATAFPEANLTLRMEAVFHNANNEIQEKTIEAEFLHRQSAIVVSMDKDSVRAAYLENGVPVERRGSLKKSTHGDTIAIRFPYSEKTDTYSEEYTFSIMDAAGKLITENFVPDHYSLSFSRTMQGDTAGFVLHNPQKVPVYYTVLYGSKIIAKGGDSSETISWRRQLSPRKVYAVEWRYWWKGEEQNGAGNVAVLDKLLQTSIQSDSAIYPGQTDTIRIAVKDYKGRAAAGVNLTAAGYNSQFGKDIRVPEPPYLKNYKGRRGIKRSSYELDQSGISRKMLLHKYSQWFPLLGIDSMQYYRFLFPADSLYKVATRTGEFVPQLAVHAVDKGVPQEIYLLYINREMVYYNGVTDKGEYAFSVPPGYVQIGFRLRDKYVQVDSIYIQPYYKHDIVFDIGKLSAKAVQVRDNFYNATERYQIESGIWQLQNDYRTNYGYIWQYDRAIWLLAQGRHLVGPFKKQDSLQYFKPGDFDLKLPFESGYEYRLTPKMARLEKKNIFPDIPQIKLPKIPTTSWILGDTIRSLPVIKYDKPVVKPVLKPVQKAFLAIPSEGGTLQLRVPRIKDTVFVYAVLYQADSVHLFRIYQGWLDRFSSIAPGSYHLVLVTANFSYVTASNLVIRRNETLCVQWEKPVFETSNACIDKILADYRVASIPVIEEEPSKNRMPQLAAPSGSCVIRGTITDKKGKQIIPGAVLGLKGYNASTVVNAAGEFLLLVKPGKYIVVASAIGYASQEKEVWVTEAGVVIDMELMVMENALEEVVVTGYGIQKRKMLVSSITSVKAESLTTVLQGKVAGINMDNVYADSIKIRGVSSIDADVKPVYVVNGVMMDELPEGFDMSTAQVEILKGAEATALYGSRAINGVILITTSDFIPPALREKFRDYAFWQPNLLTDKNGEASFVVTYPDNITGWQTYVLGMDKKRRITRATRFVQSFKQLQAQLATPQFMVAGDSVAMIGKITNYTKTVQDLRSSFTVNDQLRAQQAVPVPPNAAAIEELWLQAATADTILAKYEVATTGGYVDGELRKIPVIQKGAVETTGNFWVLEKDTIVSFTPSEHGGPVTIHAENNTLDMLLDELEQLKKYPYYCMEQTASKLTGLVLERKIRVAMKQPFKEEKEMRRLITRLQKAQLFDGSWGWWEGSRTNLAITNYITRALLFMREDPLIATNIRNALLYLHNSLPVVAKGQLLDALSTLSEAGHVMDYNLPLARLKFDSLTLHQQWQWVKIRQEQQMNYTKELDKLIQKGVATMLGGLHWGADTYYWDNNTTATTLIAFRVLQKEKDREKELKQIIRFFLERRKKGHWTNTVESAGIVAAILPSVLAWNMAFTAPATLTINNSKETATAFPFTTVLHTSQPLTIQKSGGGLVYLTTYQRSFIPDPQPVTDNFVVQTFFEKNSRQLATLKAGEKVIMKVQVNVLKDADYVQLEVPIPAGCTYGRKIQDGYDMHREYLKEKTVFFMEKLTKGQYSYDIELEARYNGRFTINPAQVSLMYFPVFFGRNGLKEVTVEK